ncbi:MAG: hypothetical protein J2O46_04835 [Nocardioides sp.]|nr:hypothetical protein [Nocardioides sp.]
MKEVWYVVGLGAVSLLVLAAGQWFVRYELRTRLQPPPTAVIWAAYAVVAAIVVLGALRTSLVVLG